jgi:nitrogen fixation NifU-like protein
VSQPAIEARDLYQSLILEHSRNPRHFGRLADATHTADGINPLCGDKLRIYLRVGDDGRIESSFFEGSGCAISMASASLMTETMNGLSVDAADDCAAEMAARLVHGAEHAPRAELEPLRALEAVRGYPGRVRCATLAWQALRAALNNSPTPVSTEQDH